MSKQLTLKFPLVYRQAIIKAPYFKEESEPFKLTLEKLLGVKLKLSAKKNPEYNDSAVGDWIIDLL